VSVGQAGGRLVVVSGPSGVGKSSLLAEARKRTGARFSVSATTRRPRPGEVDGRDYHFVSAEKFREMIEADELLEWAEVFGRYYGTPKQPVRQAVAAGETVVLDIDVQGARQVHEKMPEAAFVLVAPPSLDELERRLEGRGSEGPDERAQRLRQARRELDAARECGFYEYTIVNDELDRAVEEMTAILRE